MRKKATKKASFSTSVWTLMGDVGLTARRIERGELDDWLNELHRAATAWDVSVLRSAVRARRTAITEGSG